MSAKEVALCLSGGGFRGVAHVGVLKFLEEQNIKIKALSGSSAGSIVALLIASGKKSDEIIDIIKQIQKRDVFKLSKNPGFFSLDNFETFLRDRVDVKSFDDLKIPLFVCVTNLADGKASYLNSGDPIESVIASSSLSPIFEAKKIDNNFYIDGGFADNLPLTPLKNRDYKVFSISVNPIKKEPVDSTKDLLVRSLLIMLNSNIRRSSVNSDAFLEIQGTTNMHIFDFSSIDRAYEYGYKETKNAWEKIVDNF